MGKKKRRTDEKNEKAYRLGNVTRVKRENFWRDANRPHQGIDAEREKFIHGNLTGAHKVLHPDKKDKD